MQRGGDDAGEVLVAPSIISYYPYGKGNYNIKQDK